MSDGPRLRFERLAAHHLDDVLVIESEAYPEPWTRGMFQQEIDSDLSQFFVMYVEDALCGYGGFWKVVDEAHITNVAVCAQRRGQGLGRALMEFLLDHAVQLELRLATLEVRLSNLAARNLYLGLGFRPVGIRKDYYPKPLEDALVMIKDLPTRLP